MTNRKAKKSMYAEESLTPGFCQGRIDIFFSDDKLMVEIKQDWTIRKEFWDWRDTCHASVHT